MANVKVKLLFFVCTFGAKCKFFSPNRLSDTNTECKESTCIVKWEHRTDVSPCTEYFVTVGTATVHVRTRPPGIYINDCHSLV